MNALAANPAYTALLAKTPPRVIRSEEQNDAYVEALYEMEQRQASWSFEEAELADVLTLLIEDYEAKHYDLPRSSPVQVLEFLMEQHGIQEEDLLNIFGSAIVAAEVMSGRRELDKRQIEGLSERFNVSPELFF